MGGEWIECKLADACRSIDYGLTASAENEAVGPRFLRITDIVSGHIDWCTVPHVVADEATIEKYRLDDGDIVIARTGASTGASAYVKSPPTAVFASYLVRLKARSEFDPRFLAYYLKSDVFRSYIRGVLGDKSAQPNASASTMTQAPLRAPKSKREQRAIAHILGTLDDKIELNRRMNETLEGMARALFKSWFVDFDPVRAKMEGRDPGLPQHLADLFPDRLVGSEVGEVPEAWEVGSIYQVGKVIFGAPFKSSFFNEEGRGLPLIRIRDLKTHDPKIFTDEEHPKGYLVSPGDLLVGMDGEFRAHLWQGPQAWLNQRVCCFKPKKGIPRAFIHYSIERPLRFFENSKTGTTVIHLGKRDIDGFRIIIPPEPLLFSFQEIADTMDSKVLINAQQSRTLAALRDTLLPKLISGKLRVQDAERFIGEAVA